MIVSSKSAVIFNVINKKNVAVNEIPHTKVRCAVQCINEMCNLSKRNIGIYLFARCTFVLTFSSMYEFF